MTFSIKESDFRLTDGFTVTAHSGCEGTPDNSMEFLEKCINLNVAAAEMDVTFRKDGTPVIIHKETAENGEGLRLDEALKYISENTDNMLLNLDLKAFDRINEVVTLTEKFGLQNRCYFTGVGEEHIKSVSGQCKVIPYYLNISFPRFKKHSKAFLSHTADKIKESGAVGINCHYSLASKKMVSVFREKDLLVSFWTANSERVMKKLLKLSPDNITTRFPVKLGNIIEKR